MKNENCNTALVGNTRQAFINHLSSWYRNAGILPGKHVQVLIGLIADCVQTEPLENPIYRDVGNTESLVLDDLDRKLILHAARMWSPSYVLDFVEKPDNEEVITGFFISNGDYLEDDTNQLLLNDLFQLQSLVKAEMNEFILVRSLTDATKYDVKEFFLPEPLVRSDLLETHLSSLFLSAVNSRLVYQTDNADHLIGVMVVSLSECSQRL